MPATCRHSLVHSIHITSVLKYYGHCLHGFQNEVQLKCSFFYPLVVLREIYAGSHAHRLNAIVTCDYHIIDIVAKTSIV